MAINSHYRAAIVIYILRWSWLVITCLVLLLETGNLTVFWHRNQVGRFVLHAVVANTAAQNNLDWVNIEQDCHLQWLHGIYANAAGQPVARLQSFEKALSCSSEYVELLQSLAPNQRDWAEQATRLYPQSAQAWFWLADTMTNLSGGSLTPIIETERSQIIQIYQQALILDSYDSMRWRYLGDLLTFVDMKAAIQAYLKACQQGDYGYHGCFRAGYWSEKQGDFEQAIRYYRLSEWPAALQRADELENQITTPP